MRRFRRDLFRAGIMALLILVVLVGVGIVARSLIGSSADNEPVAAESESTTTTESVTTTRATTTTAATTTTTVPTTTTTTEPIPPVRDPSRVGVAVFNATSIGGLAGRLTDRLAGVGYRTNTPADHSERLDNSVIWYVNGYDREAALLAEIVAIDQVVSFPGDAPPAPLTVVLGTDFEE
ncbi:MAG: LytR C-terminal domain-containing protein [bacterium]|nr:LytR C-terminal domain-containing protein [bacterium]MCY3653259.1 LytR C-terminal domain-containing protein [bacterium]MXX63928.1 LytR family transcriptional regulator [Acidimicrobiia bacterium]MYD04534.1 LytR family transcriptional regulator [Acidimicrobiia bacterium]